MNEGFNTKPILLKRLIADGFDVVCVFMLMLVMAFFLENSAIASTYQTHVANYRAVEEEVLKNSDPKLINELLADNENYQNEVFAAGLHHYLLVIMELFIVELILFLIVPMFNRDGASIGKLMCGLLLFDESRQARINRFQIFVRFVYIFLESILLYPWTGIYTILLIPVLRLIVMMLNSKNRTLLDIASGTMLIEKNSYRSFD